MMLKHKIYELLTGCSINRKQCGEIHHDHVIKYHWMMLKHEIYELLTGCSINRKRCGESHHDHVIKYHWMMLKHIIYELLTGCSNQSKTMWQNKSWSCHQISLNRILNQKYMSYLLSAQINQKRRGEIYHDRVIKYHWMMPKQNNIWATYSLLKSIENNVVKYIMITLSNIIE